MTVLVAELLVVKWKDLSGVHEERILKWSQLTFAGVLSMVKNDS